MGLATPHTRQRLRRQSTIPSAYSRPMSIDIEIFLQHSTEKSATHFSFFSAASASRPIITSCRISSE